MKRFKQLFIFSVLFALFATSTNVNLSYQNVAAKGPYRLLGAFNEWNGDSNTKNVDNLHTYTVGEDTKYMYYAKHTIYGEFKARDSDVEWLGVGNLNDQARGTGFSGSDNIVSPSAAAPGEEYTFLIFEENNRINILKNVYLVGNFADKNWQTADSTRQFTQDTVNPWKFTFETELKADDEFKIVFGDSWDGDLGYGCLNQDSKERYLSDANGNIKADVGFPTGDYLITLDMVHYSIDVSPKSLIETVAGYQDGIDNLRTRIWLDRGHYGDNGIVVLEVNDVLYEPSGHEHALYVEDGGVWFAYYDMEISKILNKEIRFKKIKSDKTALWNTTSTLTYSSGDSSYLFKVPSDEGDTLSKGAITNRIMNSFLAKVLEGYLTCSTSAENGYNAFAAIDTNFLPRDGEGHWNLEGNLDEVDIIDYAGVGTSGYGSDRGTGVEVDAYDKYVALQTLYDLNNDNGNAEPVNLNVVSHKFDVTLLLSILSLVTLIGYFSLSRKTRKI